MFLRIENLPTKTFAGKHLDMSYANNLTAELWQSFMKEKGQIKNTIGTDLYSLQDYGETDFAALTPQTIFTKWALTEIADVIELPNNFETFNLEGGKYAVFLHKGTASDFARTFDYIFKEWLPASGYKIDQRPHFEKLGEKYKNNQPDSEEEIWLPIKEGQN